MKSLQRKKKKKKEEALNKPLNRLLQLKTKLLNSPNLKTNN